MDSVHRRTSWLKVTAVSAAVAVIAFIGGWLLRPDTAMPPPPWDPLGDYPPQQVRSRDLPDVGGPSVLTPGVVEVTATKCVASTEDSGDPGHVTVQGFAAWQRVEPLGRIIRSGEGTARRSLGCTTVDYKNDVPDEVIESTAAVGGEAVWRITGEECPVKANGTKGVCRQWQTQNFTLRTGGQ